MILGAGVAVVLRIIFTAVVASLMLLPWLKIVGGLALFYIAVKLLVPEDEDKDEVEAVEHLWRAVRIVAIADIVMSLDNVIAIAAAAQGNVALLVIGLAISIPLIVAGAALVMALLDRLSDPGLGRRRAARLDRRRGHRHRSGPPWLPRAPVRGRGIPLHRALRGLPRRGSGARRGWLVAPLEAGRACREGAGGGGIAGVQEPRSEGAS